MRNEAAAWLVQAMQNNSFALTATEITTVSLARTSTLGVHDDFCLRIRRRRLFRQTLSEAGTPALADFIAP